MAGGGGWEGGRGAHLSLTAPAPTATGTGALPEGPTTMLDCGPEGEDEGWAAARAARGRAREGALRAPRAVPEARIVSETARPGPREERARGGVVGRA